MVRVVRGSGGRCGAPARDEAADQAPAEGGEPEVAGGDDGEDADPRVVGDRAPQDLRDHDAPEDCEYYMCGPPMMTSAVIRMLEDLGVERDNIFLDDFGG